MLGNKQAKARRAVKAPGPVRGCMLGLLIRRLAEFPPFPIREQRHAFAYAPAFIAYLHKTKSAEQNDTEQITTVADIYRSC